ncbi:AraC family transcriptional regulator [Paenibacillus sp. CF384]|uniref:helix-turn-helix transcriptional regulator n=1 Tax=Paenibacillus sp. CF384 TaxID=1884382 RepID=UPI0008988C2E|nr:AraC family transcriptional regulator [Paenibacillus sp. CF384]SDW66104.1 AraC family transcriptional regulator, arabinose operon regulatory protein [Paenibacillus sp. CF384]
MDALVGPELLPALQVTRVSAGSIVYPPGSQFGPRYQTDYQLVMLHSGSIDLLLDQHLQVIPPGHVVLLKPGHWETFRFAEDQDTWHRWITLTPEFPVPELLDRLHALPLYLPLSQEMTQLTDLAIAIKQIQKSEFNGALRKLGLTALDLYAAECAHHDASRSTHPAILIAKATIKDQYERDLTIADLAFTTNLSKDHLIRLFRRELGITPMQYLWNYRLERGIELLRHSGLSIGEIAYRVGFKTSYHFARSIKNYTGLTPTLIRRNNWHRERDG